MFKATYMFNCTKKFRQYIIRLRTKIQHLADGNNAIKKNADKCAVKTIKTHERKLRNLTKNVTLPFRDTKTVHKCMLLKNIEI